MTSKSKSYNFKLRFLYLSVFFLLTSQTHSTAYQTKDNIRSDFNNYQFFSFHSQAYPNYQIQTSILTQSAHRTSNDGQIFSTNKTLKNSGFDCLSIKDSAQQNEVDTEFEICNTKTSSNVKYRVENTPLYLEIYPNPSIQKLIIKVDYKLQNSMCIIFNIAGDVVLKQKLDNNLEQTLDISRFTKGIYFVRIDYKGESLVRKFVKQ